MNSEVIIEIFTDILDKGEGEITEFSSPEDIDEWDSVATVNLIVAIESEFNIKLRLEDIENAKNVKDFIDLVDNLA